MSLTKLKIVHSAMVVVAAILFVMCLAIRAQAATAGDQLPKGRTGQSCSFGDDAGVHIGTKVFLYPDGGNAMMPGQNAFAVQNPSGSAGTVCCGFDDTTSCAGSRAGFPVTPGSTVSVDLTCPSPGVGATNGSCPNLYCTTAQGLGALTDDGGISCLRWMEVK